MHRKIIITGLVVVLIILMASAVFAQRGPRAGGFGGGMLGQFTNARVAARLNLTPDQTKQIQEIVSAHRTAMQPAQRPAPGTGPRIDHEALLKSIITDKPDQAEIQKRMDAMLQQQTAMAQERQQRLGAYVDTMLEINKVLTPAQRSEFQKMLDENTRARQMMGRRMMQRRNQ